MQSPTTIEVKGIKVLTTKQIAEAYEVTKDKIIYNFNYNKDKYILGKHYIEVSGDELRRLKTTCENQMSFKYAKSLYLWTEKGALLHAKSLNTDKAWEVYDYLVDFYFRVKEQTPVEVKKKSGREVVDIPENPKIQEGIVGVRKYLATFDVLLDEYNKYSCEANYIHTKRVLENLWVGLGRELTELMDIEPKLVIKEGY